MFVSLCSFDSSLPKDLPDSFRNLPKLYVLSTNSCQKGPLWRFPLCFTMFPACFAFPNVGVELVSYMFLQCFLWVSLLIRAPFNASPMSLLQGTACSLSLQCQRHVCSLCFSQISAVTFHISGGPPEPQKSHWRHQGPFPSGSLPVFFRFPSGESGTFSQTSTPPEDAIIPGGCATLE